MVEKVCTPMDGKGKVLADLLMDEIGIPKNCTGFDVSFNAGEAITVTIRTYLREPSGASAVDVTPVTGTARVFKLIEIGAEPTNDLTQRISAAVREVIKSERRQGGALWKLQNGVD